MLLEEDPPRTLAGLKLDVEAELERRLGVPVQLVVLNRAPPDLVHWVLRDGKLVLDRDRSHIVADDRLGEPATNRQLFEILARHGWITRELEETLRQIVGFRNVVVHGYSDVDLEIVREVVETGLDDLLAFATAIRGRLAAG